MAKDYYGDPDLADAKLAARALRGCKISALVRRIRRSDDWTRLGRNCCDPLRTMVVFWEYLVLNPTMRQATRTCKNCRESVTLAYKGNKKIFYQEMLLLWRAARKALG